jgi:glycosyltransferase involved in cell wall biosynthesis
MKVAVLGVRGMLNVQGGIETHAEELYERLVRLGVDVEVMVRTPYVARQRRAHGVIRMRRLWSPTTSGIEPLVHSVLGVIYAAFTRPDLLHIHAVGPAIVTPLARLLGLRVVVTHHGPDYERDKWGPLARLALRLGERLGMRYAHARIAVSGTIATQIRTRFGRDADFIPNGVAAGELQSATDELERLGLTPRRYFLQVSRIVPEKRQLDLIEAFAAVQPAGWSLVLVGGAGENEYSRKLQSMAAATPGVVLAGFKKGLALKQLYSHAGCFVLPSSHEGLPIAMLEALSYGLPVLASAIPANLDVKLPESSYFPVGDTAALTQRLRAFLSDVDDDAERESRRRWVQDTYDWARIARQTHAVYCRVLGLHAGHEQTPSHIAPIR